MRAACQYAAFDEPLEDGRRPRVESFSALELLGAAIDSDSARNVNTPGDLERLQARMLGARGIA